MAKFAASNYVNMSMEIISFFADYGFHSQTGIKPSGIYKGKQKAELLAKDEIIKKQAEMMTFLQDQLAWVQDK